MDLVNAITGPKITSVGQTAAATANPRALSLAAAMAVGYSLRIVAKE